MTLTPGTRLGSYDVLAPLGAGGMGEVYRARDTRLGREVAIKALPAEFASDPERLARFEREARLLASLSHPNIAGIHGLEVVDGARYLVLEFVEGDTLAARLAHGPLPVDECIDVCRQIAAGVEAAHEAGVVHRDLKPGNVMLRSDGVVKVLDFGLAKGNAAQAGSSSDVSISASPTMTYAPTNAGVILGTAAYMSPEQARGRAVDRRTDVWSFGCVLFECLTGGQVFIGETISDMVARILERDPAWETLPAATPPRLRELLRRCLTKDMKQRLQSIGEARIALEQPMTSEPAAAAAAPARRRSRVPVWAPWAAAAACALTAVVALFAPGARRGAVGEQRVEIGTPAGQRVDESFPAVLSPDGRQIVAPADDSSGVSHLWLRGLDEFDFHMLKGTDDAYFPVWSPNGRELAFAAHGALWRLSLADGSVQKIVGGVSTARGMSWGRDGTILYTPDPNEDIWRVPASGGTPVRVTHRDTTLVDVSHRFPLWLPDGKHFLFAFWSNNPHVQDQHGGIYLTTLDGKPPRRLSPDTGAFALLPRGYLLVARNGGVAALPFNLRTFAVGTDAIPLADHVAKSASSGLVPVSASASGDIALTMSVDRARTDLAWVDRAGHRGAPLGLRNDFESIVLSPDATHVAGEIGDANGLTQVWVADLTRGTVSRLTHGQNDSGEPVWSPDGMRLAYLNFDRGLPELHVQVAAGTRPAERLWAPRDMELRVAEWSADGRFIFCQARAATGNAHGQVWVVDTQTRAARVVLSDDFDQYAPHLSPDGRWLAYVSNESGRDEVYVRSYPDLVGKWQVSTNGGTPPHWRRDGRELVFGNGAGPSAALWSVGVSPAGANLTIGEPQRLFARGSDVLDVQAAPDHSRFLELIEANSASVRSFHLVQHWNPKGSR